MKHLRILLATVVLLASCGGGTADGGPTTTAVGSTTTATPATTTTTQPVTTTAVTTTTEATTTLAADAHPTLGISWASVWPAEDESARYLATSGPNTFDVEAHLDYGVDYQGTVLDRLIIGTPEPGNEGAAIYFDRSEPWVLKIYAVESYSEDTPGGPALVESFVDPLVFDGTLGIGETYDVQSEITLAGPGFGDTMGVTYAITPATLEDSVTVPYGTVDGVLRLDVGIGGQFMGDSLFTTSLWLDADLFLIRFDNPPEWERLELVEPWS